MYDKLTSKIIIVLLVIFIPLSIIGLLNRKEDIPNAVDENPNKETFYNNKVYFYNANELLGTYSCIDCKKTETIIDDTNYHTNYYKYGTEELKTVQNSILAIFTEGDKIEFYNIVSQKKTMEFDAIKTYNISNNNNLYFGKIANLWQIIEITEEGVKSVVVDSFDYVAIPNHIENNILNSDKLIVRKNNNWEILDIINNKSVITSVNEIVDFNNYYYIVYNNGYQILTYNNTEILPNLTKKNVATVGDYLFIVSNGNILFIYKKNDITNYETMTLPEYTEIDFTNSDEGIKIMLDKNLYQTIAPN